MDSLKKYCYGAAAAFLLGTLAVPANHAAAEEETEETAAPVATEQRGGTVDAVSDDHLVINDSSIPLNGSLQFYNEGGGRMSGSEFRVGDKVEMVLIENKVLGSWELVSVTRTKGGSAETPSTTPSQQVIRKDADGVWRN